MLGIQPSMHRTAEGELLCSIYLLTPWDFEGLVEGVGKVSAVAGARQVSRSRAA